MRLLNAFRNHMFAGPTSWTQKRRLSGPRRKVTNRLAVDPHFWDTPRPTWKESCDIFRNRWQHERQESSHDTLVLDRSLRRAVAFPVFGSIDLAGALDEDKLEAAAVAMIPESDTEFGRNDMTSSS